MPPQQSHILDYEACSADELRSFIEGRLGKFSRASRRGRPKRLYVDTLKRLDRDLTFHQFLDLPPELRLLVYRELLVVDPFSAKRQPPETAILQTCKLIKKEAGDVLYGENEVRVDLFTRPAGCTQILMLPGMCCHERTSTLPRGAGSALRFWSPQPTRFQRVHVQLVVMKPECESSIHEARFQISVLASFVGQSRARIITVVCYPPSAMVDMNFYMLQPLAQPGTRTKVSFERVPPEDAGRLTALATTAPSFDDPGVDEVLTEWFKTVADVQKEIHGTRAEGQEADRLLLEASFDTTKDRVYKIEYYDTKAEQRLCEAISILKRILSEQRMRRMET